MPPEDVTIESPETEVTDESVTNIITIVPPVEPEEETAAEQAIEDARFIELAERMGRIEDRLDVMAAAAIDTARAEEEESESQLQEPPTETVIENSQPEDTETEAQPAASGHRFPGWL